MGNILYIFFILLALVFVLIADKKNKKVFLYISIIIFSLVSGLRGINVGIDTALYNNAFLHNFPYSWQFEETGFRYISTFIMNLFHDPRYVFCFFAFITNGLILTRLWDFREKCSMTAMVLLYSLTFYIDTMNIMRQFVVIAVIFYSTKLLEKNKYILFLLIILGLTFIHSSSLLALAYIPIYLWNSLSKSKKMLLIIPLIVCGSLAISYVIGYESGHISNYLSAQNSIDNVNIPFLYRVIIFAISYFLLVKNKIVIFKKNSIKKVNSEYSQEISKYRNVSYVYMAGLLLCSMGMFYVVMARLGYYYAIFELVYWGYVIKTSANKKMNFAMIITYAVYIFLLEFLTDGSGVFPFEFNL